MINDYEVDDYKGKWIVATTFGYRVKSNPTDDFALHSGTFNTIEEAKKYIDSKNYVDIKTK